MIDTILSKCGLVRSSVSQRRTRLAEQQATSRTRAEERNRYRLTLYDTEQRAIIAKQAERVALQKAADALAQRDTLQGLYDRANKRLERAGMISVTTFV